MRRKDWIKRRLESLRDECRRAAMSARVSELRVEQKPDSPIWSSDPDEKNRLMGVYLVTDTRNDQSVEVWDFRNGTSISCHCGDSYCHHAEAVHAFRGEGEERKAEASRRCVRVEEMRFLQVFYADGARGEYSGLRDGDDPDTVDPRDLNERGYRDGRGGGILMGEDIQSVLYDIETERRHERETAEPFTLTVHATRKDDWELHVRFCYAETGEKVWGAEEHALVRQTGRKRGEPRLDKLREPEWLVRLIHACLEGTPLEQPEDTRRKLAWDGRLSADFGVEVTDEVLAAINGRRVRAYLTMRDGGPGGRRLKKHTIELLPEGEGGDAHGDAHGDAGKAAGEEPPPEPPPEPEAGDAPKGGSPGVSDALREKARRLGIDYADLLRAEARASR